jgi:hypothetical protein
MSLLPLSGGRILGEACVMRKDNQQVRETSPLAGTLASIARRVSAVVSECNYAQRRLNELRLGLDQFGSRQAPDTYGEFLHLTSGSLRHEPPARDR